MAIHVTKTSDVLISASDLRRLRYEYERAFMMYSGPCPDFEEWAINRIQKEEQREELIRHSQFGEEA